MPESLATRQTSGPIGDGGEKWFRLRHGPNGVYLSDGRFIPSRDHAAAGIDDREPVVDIERSGDNRECGVGILGRVDVKK